MWRTRLNIQAGKKGTKKLQKKYGERLLCVRYRYDDERMVRRRTVELLEDEKVWRPNPRRQRWVFVRVAFAESELRRKVKAAGGSWDRQKHAWKIRRAKIESLGLIKRIVR
jgi:hypothetical protein